MKQIIKFGIVGTIGFGVDALVLLLFVEKFLFSIEVSRVFSFLCAVFVTWLINRRYTFMEKKKYSKKKEYFYYLIIQTLGAGINYMIFIFLIKSNMFFEKNLVLALAIASLIAMFFNFFMLKRKLFN